ncbi:hypothetical protein [uncultured Gemmiger sp.]|uniref:hypothetical protein n=1 Tax=uncultured Gemmiger sp. TaxID=1623490 RepID=UPI0025D53561|nr:hypothetical protein [uncultured Gemmiger sp.]
MYRTKTARIALCGVLGALTLVLMELGSVLPLATYAAPMLAAFALIPLVQDCPLRYAWLTWAAAALLGLMLLPDRELALTYALVLGPYPMLKKRLDKLPCRPLRMAAKLAVFNAAVLACYGLLLVVFPVPGLWEEFSGGGLALIVVTLAVGNVAFAVFDMVLALLAVVYRHRLRPLLKLHR